MSQEKVVKVYSTEACPWCKKAKAFLSENSVPFTDLNVAEDKEAREEMIKNSGQMGVPVIDIDGQIIIGYNEAEIKAKLNLA